jgi:homocysteine S-methyltransferase
MAGGLFLSDGGLETTLLFLDRIELPHFAAFVSLDGEFGRERLQAEALAAGDVDMFSAVTMTSSVEALGVAWAAERVGLPVAISFTVETDGRLPNGESLGVAIERVDASARPAYFAINCAHPTHFAHALDAAGPWAVRIRGIRANASTKSHAELDESSELDIGDPSDLATRFRGLRSVLPNLNILGGCCGTDWRHLRAVRDAWLV